PNGTRPCRCDNSRCVCALTSAGSSATRPRWCAAEPAGPTETTRPAATVTAPLRIGGVLMGSTQSAATVGWCTLLRQTLLFAGPAPGGIVLQLLGNRRVTVDPRGGQRQHARHVLMAEHRLAEQFVVHVAPHRGVAGILDVGD